MQAYQNSSDVPTRGATSGDRDRASPAAVIATPDQDQQRLLSDFLGKEHPRAFLLPMLELIQGSKLAADELIVTMGTAALEAIVQLSAEQVAGPKQQGKRQRDRDRQRPIRHHGTQDGIVELAERKLKVKRPRLRRREGGDGAEVPIPAYQAMRHNAALGKRMLEILLDGVSTRRYRRVLPEMADTLGISKSAVSRQIIDKGERVLRELAERRFDDLEILIIWIDGIEFAGHHILAAVGVDTDGYKHVLGICHGAAENTVTVTTLLESMVERGVRPTRRRLFVIDGSKALRAAINKVYGTDNPVQRCRNHKLRNVISHLPEPQHEQAKSALRAAWKLPPDQGIARLEQLAKWYERDQPGAAASIREGLAELFTINRLGLPQVLCKCLATTNLIDSGHSAIRRASGRVTRWRDGSMALRWAACALVAAEGRFSKIQGCQQLWILKAHLDSADDTTIEQPRRTG